jgi:hypothetical protein
MIIIVGHLFHSGQKKVHEVEVEGIRTKHDKLIKQRIVEYATVLEGMHQALQTKSAFEKTVLSSNDPNLSVSYWFRYEGSPYVFVTTENQPTQDHFPNDNTSLIGCGFVALNKIVSSDKNGIRAFEFDSDEEDKKHTCEKAPRAEEIKSIVCSAFQSSATSNRDATVGICVFTSSEKSILIPDHRKFLRDETKAFYNRFQKSIEEKTVTALFERTKLEKEAAK